MTVIYHQSQHINNSQWNDIMKKFDVSTNSDVYIIEPRRPKQGHFYLSTWLQSEMPFIPEAIKLSANKDKMLIVFHIYEWLNIDYDQCLELFANEIDLKAVRVLVPFTPSVSEHKWIQMFPSFWMGYQTISKNTPTVQEVKLTTRSKKFTCLNGLARPHRQYTISKLIANNVLHDGYASLVKFKNEYVIGNDCRFTTTKDMSNEYVQNINADIIKKIMPLSPDNLTRTEHNNHSLNELRYMNDSYWNIVTETLNLNVIDGFITEKTFKPIANLQPFVIIGTYRSLWTLRELGFKTFGDFIDESYDELNNETKRLKASVNVALELAQMSHSKHVKLMAKIKPILVHNQRLFQSKDALKKYFELLLR